MTTVSVKAIRQSTAVLFFMAVLLPCAWCRQVNAVAKKETKPQTIMRVIEFPATRTVGMLYMGKINADSKFERIYPAKPARGKVQVAAGADTLLEVNFEGSTNLSFLGTLKANDLGSLSFSNNGRGFSLEDASLRSIDRLNGLRQLDIEQTQAGNETMKLIEHLTNLESINIADTTVTTKGLASIAKLNKLIVLIANNLQLSDLLESLKDSIHLRTLEIKHDGVTSAGLKALTKLIHLHDLRLGNNKIGDAGLRDLPVLPELNTLDIDNCGITEAGAIYLNNFPELVTLYAADLPLTPTTFKQLSKLKKLTTVIVAGAAVKPDDLKGLEAMHWQIKLSASAQDEAAIKKLLPKCHVEFAPRAPLELFHPFSK